MSKTLAIQLFLQRLKILVAEGKVKFDPRKKRKSWAFMLEHGFTEEDIHEVLKLLEPEHYNKGPEADHNGTAGSIYAFICSYDQLEIYIKAKIITDNAGDEVVILSFHEEGNYE